MRSRVEVVALRVPKTRPAQLARRMPELRNAARNPQKYRAYLYPVAPLPEPACLIIIGLQSRV